jgi:hypothetical protein
MVIMLSALFEYFASVSQQAIQCEPPFRGRVEMLHFGRYTLVTHEANGETHRRWFLDESPIFSYYLETNARRQLVAAVFKSGCKAGEVAELLGLTDSAVSADLKFLRTNYPDQVEPQVKAVDATPSDRVLKNTAAMKPQAYQPAASGFDSAIF